MIRIYRRVSVSRRADFPLTQRLVDRADLVFAAWNGRPGSGTAMAVRMASARGVPVIWVEMV